MRIVSLRLFFSKSIVVFSLIFCCLCIPNLSYSRGNREGAGKEELVFWHSIGTYNKNILNRMIDDYNTEHAKPFIKSVFQGGEQDLYLSLFSQENLPDIVQIPVQLLGTIVEKNLLVDLDQHISQKLRNDIPSKFWESVMKEDRVYGMPFSYSVNILFVNQHILRISGWRGSDEPKSWEEMLAVINRIKQNAEGRYAFFIPMESLAHFISFVESYAGSSIFEGDRIVVDGDGAISAMRFLQNAVYEKGLMPSKITIEEGTQMFLSGNLGLMLGSSSTLVYTKSNLPYDLNVWHLPSWEKVGPRVFGSCLAIVRSNTRREREAFRFIEYLVDYDRAIKWHTNTGDPAIRSSVKESLDLLIFYEENPNYMASVIELESGVIFAPSFDYFKVNDIIKSALAEIMVNRQDPESVLKGAQAKIDELGGS
jgi:multiple sugar transport system substrate-binding protein